MIDTTAKSGSELLLEAAQRLFLAHGYANVSMQAIAAEAGMTKGAPYYHFESKEDLFYQVSLRILDGLSARLAISLDGEGTLEERLTDAFFMIIFNLSSDFSSWINDVKRSLGPERQRCLIEAMDSSNGLAMLVQPSFERAAARGELREMNPAVAADVFFKLAMASVDEANYLQVAGLFTEELCEQTARNLAHVLVHGIGAT